MKTLTEKIAALSSQLSDRSEFAIRNRLRKMAADAYDLEHPPQGNFSEMNCCARICRLANEAAEILRRNGDEEGAELVESCRV